MPSFHSYRRGLKSSIAAALLTLLALNSQAQQPAQLRVQPLTLPRELASPDNQFSGLFVSQKRLFLLSESRLLDPDKPEGKLYTISLPDLDRKLTDTAYVLPYRKYHLAGLELLKDKITAAGQVYEGLEAMLVDDSMVYFAVETATASPNCYLLQGQLQDSAVVMNPDFLVSLAKPTAADGSRIYNAGFEALLQNKRSLTALFEYNSFPAGNFAYPFDKLRAGSISPGKPVGIQPLPFRITDVTATRKNRFTALNYFFRGDDDQAYRPAQTDPNTALVKPGDAYRSYCRLIELRYRGNTYHWQPLAEFPAEYMTYNWEGIAAYKRGYFVINDKYTPQKPYRSTLLFVQPARR
ncbi:hypothetical protein [Hymenobacter cellulosivorans]|uniref:DUF4221 domain-containing protein n=1 Tax=Hymenobacter cellulosivorans TaxID=2932249 RepID=A0ABY4F786_9BACT|nr:hypothetical protein [Hymenobacter cellulosivorans]UOQ52537.1 hypothetical protein MUN80_22645 [Hymenobacter cellulosivorans]